MYHFRFNKFDKNADGTISRSDYVSACENRFVAMKREIERQFEALTADASARQVAMAEMYMQSHMDKYDVLQGELKEMLEKGGRMDNDGTLNIHEYALAELWWKRCVLNSQKIAVF